MGNSYTTADQHHTSASFSPFSFSEGNFRRAYKGVYEFGDLASKPCVVKIAIAGKVPSAKPAPDPFSKRKASNVKIAVSSSSTSASSSSDMNSFASSAAQAILKLDSSPVDIMSEVIKGGNSKQAMMMEDVIISNIADKLSIEFNKRKDGSSDSVKRPLSFNVPAILRIASKSFFLRGAQVGDVVCVEDFIQGDYQVRRSEGWVESCLVP